MAQQAATQDAGSINPTRYTERRAPQFAGGDVDPASGNLVLPTKSSYATPEPAIPKTKLGSIDAVSAPKPPGLAAMAGSVAAPYLGAQIGSQIGGGAGVGEAISGTASHIGEAFGFGSSGPAAVGLGEGAAPAIGSFAGGPPVSAPVAEAGMSSFGELAGSSVIGGAVGAGLGTAAFGALSGQQIKEYAPAAIGSAVGFAIGSMILPGIGGFVGSFIGGMFCHAAGTLIRMTDGTLKAIETLQIGDQVALGGRIVGRGEVLATDMFDYLGTRVNGRHAVFEDGRWLRVEKSAKATPVFTAEPVMVYPLVTEAHLLVCEHYVCADFAETNDADMSASERLAKLNANVELNQRLAIVGAPRLAA